MYTFIEITPTSLAVPSSNNMPSQPHGPICVGSPTQDSLAVDYPMALCNSAQSMILFITQSQESHNLQHGISLSGLASTIANHPALVFRAPA